MEEKELVLEKQNSVEMNLNAKGQLSGKVKCYEESGGEAFKKALELMELLRAKIEEMNK